ncbi:hypothetical protein SEA_BOOPY_41 [Gordonia phage Boopy]|nr:hypothetical protein SEA_BOOPY_41 [Gordonia phage Boopy]UXE04183.1 hypothetical protein SEA_BLUENGOLD_39 [Gordonia phage BlueNGold]WBF03822.1 hypothetical protein SEA_MAREELIH_39 [Gordonia phage Mareelih]
MTKISPADGRDPSTLNHTQKKIIVLRNKAMANSLALSTSDARRGSFTQAVDLEIQLRKTFGQEPDRREVNQDMAKMVDEAKTILERLL